MNVQTYPNKVADQEYYILAVPPLVEEDILTNMLGEGDVLTNMLSEGDVLTNMLSEGDGKDATNKYFIDVLLPFF